MTFEPVGYSSAENAMLAELLKSSNALQLSRYKEFLTHPSESERNSILDQAMEEAIHRTASNRIRGLSVRHVEGQIRVSGQANSYQSRQIVLDLVKLATEASGLCEFSARIDIAVNDEHPEVVYAGCPSATILASLVTETSTEIQTKCWVTET